MSRTTKHRQRMPSKNLSIGGESSPANRSAWAGPASSLPEPSACELQKAALVALALAGMTCVVFARALFNGFIEHYDDSKYVLENPAVRSGLTWDGLLYAFTDQCVANWHPLTMLSHMLDCELYGVRPFGHHLTNVILHAVNTALLFVVLHRMTGALWRSALVAALFSVHPLHVQSVAHVAQRKDVLSTLFWLLTMWAYVRYAAQPAIRRYIWVSLFFVLGLLSKPMLVSLPIVLLLMDYWPLNRFSGKAKSGGHRFSGLRPCLLEKLPLIGCSVISCAVTVVIQGAYGAVSGANITPLPFRARNAVLSYVAYIRMTLWPSGLAAHYPFPLEFPLWKVAGAALLLATLTWLCLIYLRNRPYWAVGWLWYVLTLVPVIGLVQVGSQAIADRYTYIPLIGLFIIAAWAAADAAERRPRTRAALAAISASALTILAGCTWVQLGYWRDGETLWRRALAVTTDNDIAHWCLGAVLCNRGDIEEGMPHYNEAVRIAGKRVANLAAYKKPASP